MGRFRMVLQEDMESAAYVKFLEILVAMSRSMGFPAQNVRSVWRKSCGGFKIDRISAGG